MSGADMLDAILKNGKLVRAGDDRPEDQQAQRTKAMKLLKEFIGQLLDDAKMKADEKSDTIELIKRQIKRIDEEIGKGVDKILHNTKFQELEAAWRGLRYLVYNTETSTRLKLRLMPVKREVLVNDLKNAPDVDQSVLFKKVYEEEYGTYGGNPFSLLIGDFKFTRSTPDLELLKNIAKVASGAHTPFISAADPDLFGMRSFTELGNPRDLAKVFESTELAAWRSFRESDDARYITLTLPRFLLRTPYGENTDPVDGFSMTEDMIDESIAYVEPDLPKNIEKKKKEEALQRAKDRRERKHSKYLWGNSAYVLGQRITNAFAMYGWCAAIRGPEGGGKVTGLPLHTFETLEGDKAMKIPTEVSITDRREKELDGLGFISLVHCKGTDYAAFFGGQTIHKPPVFDTDAANANAAISARLPYLLAASRFAHYLKVICRDKIGSFQTKDSMTQYLNRWLMTYVLGTDDAGQELKAQYPLREARIDVFDVPGKPGAYRAVVFLRPHFQLEELTASIRLVAELPPPVAA
ncbi:MAG TPA: type VI secretion system contractile sheath large subunit [Thermoanaerobaculia bacterium]|nr:type VI secretion system contractile sheath large subunit [Thermoanaerobaculia bacterium]